MAGEGLQAVPGTGDELDLPGRGFPQEGSGSAVVGESHEEEAQVPAVFDGHAAGVLDLEGIPDGLAVVLVLDGAEPGDSQETEQLEHRGNV